MKTSYYRVLFVTVAVFCIFSLAPRSQLLSAPPPPRQLLDTLRSQTDDHLQVAYHAETGALRFLRADPGHSIARAPALAASATGEQAARGFLGQYGSLFGIRSQADELALMREVASGGHMFERFQQRYKGIPILGGELIVQLDQARNIVSANGEALPDLALDTQPRISAAQAQARALAAMAAHYQIAPGALAASTPELWIYNPALLGGPGMRRNTLTWRIELRGQSAATPIRELVLVDAQSGIIALHFNQIADAKSRRICNANNSVDSNGNEKDDCTSDAAAVRIEGAAATGNTDVDLAYDYSGDTYDFYYNNFGRDSLDGNGLKLISLVKYCPDSSNCPFENAFWDGQQMTYGDGYATADDVVGHELSHGFTDFTSHLFYYYQAGAINESMSDIFGEFIDLSNGSGTDTAGTRWLMGEDLPGSGAIRNMANPTAFSDPDRTGSAFYTADTFGGDSGGVHINSGVSNKAAYLIVDGDTFNGQTITGIGLAKAAQIYYLVEIGLLTSAADYQDLGDALQTACIALEGRYSITEGDCSQVHKAVLATQMDTTPANAPATDVALCSSGSVPSHIFFDSLENTSSGNWASAATVGNNAWYYPANPNDVGIDATYATSGENNFWGYNLPSRSDSSIQMTKSVTLPSNAFMHFRHSYGFDTLSGAFDGGVVEYSVNAGSTWSDAGSLIASGDNGYDGTIIAATNPLNGRTGFVGESHGYISSRFNLSSLSGQSIRFRFRIGTNSTSDDYGWFIDDIGIYTCIDSSTLTEKNYLPLVLNKPLSASAPEPTAAPTTAPTAVPTATPSDFKPKVGFWKGPDSDEFYVSTNQAYVDNFAITIMADSCGEFIITYLPQVAISNKEFSFTGTFYGSGIFTSASQVEGVDGLDNFPIAECGAKFSGGPWDYAASWKNSSQPLVHTVQRSGPLDAAPSPQFNATFTITRIR